MNFHKLNEMAVREWLGLIGAIQVAPSVMLYWLFLFGSDMLNFRVPMITYGYKMKKIDNISRNIN